MAIVGTGIAEQIANHILAQSAQRTIRPTVRQMMERLVGEVQGCRFQLDDAEKRQLEEGDVVRWLRLVKDVYYDIIDAFDELRIVQVKSQGRYFLGPLGKFLYFNDSGGKIERLIHRMQQLNHRRKFLHLVERVNRDEGDSRQTTSLILSSTLYGRDEEAKDLRSKLVDESSSQQGIQYLSLVGTAGIGKTALAQIVYNENQVHHHFHIMAWVSVNHKFNLFRIARMIAECLSAKSVDMVELEFLIQHIARIIEGKRFLFVLDDLEDIEDDAMWESFRAVLEHGAPESRILITTRYEIVAHNAGCKPQQIMRVRRLSDEDCWSIIRRYAFNSSTDESEEVRAFSKVGRQIANKCDGLPLNACSLGGILRFRRSESEWLEVLEADIWKMSSYQDIIIPSLMLSYHFLPTNVLRQCLLYCSIFPKDHIINVDKLIKLWIAQGYFDIQLDTMELEKKAARCFQELLNRSFFHELKKDDQGNFTCKLEGAISELIQLLAENECLILHADEKTEFEDSSTNGRHWTLKLASQTSLPDFIGNTSKLHTLMVLAEYSYTDPKTLSSLLSHFRRLRALDLSYCSVRELPVKAGSLLHLRYLDLSFNRDLKKLPKVICDSSFLQTLNLNGCDSLRKLPKGIGKLSSLRHLEILWTKSLSYLPKGISSLTSLRTLNRFVGNDVHNKACNFGDLKELNHLQGYISVDGLGGGTDVAQAEKACLNKKEGILGLELWFSGVGYKVIKDVDVLKALVPPPTLECLGIYYYKATSFPCWITKLEHLRELMLSDCNECIILPALAKLKHLQALEIRKMPKLQRIGAEFLEIKLDGGQEANSEMSAFPKLQKLHFHKLTKWNVWEDIAEGKILSVMPQLTSLSITSCTNISAFPNYIKKKIEENWMPILEECPLLQRWPDGLDCKKETKAI